MVLGKLSVPERPTNLDNSRARAYCACSRCGLRVVWYVFFSPCLFSLLSPSLEGGPIYTAILSRMAFKPKITKQTINLDCICNLGVELLSSAN